jgi:hypothetical protein
MSRGDLKSILTLGPYKDSEKNWFIETQHSQIHWYELLANKHALFDTKKHIRDELSDFKKHVEDNLEKRFIYFIFSRKKVRFDTTRQPRKSLFNKNLKVHLLVGKDEKKVSISVGIQRRDGKPIMASVDEKFITISMNDEDHMLMSIHDFLLTFEVNLGIFSKVEYVGYTKNPENRPTNGAHSGLSNILHNVSNDGNDILIAFNLFKVTTQGSDSASGMDFLVANAMSDEINVDLEGMLIEKSLILYFDSNNQEANKQNERNELLNSLTKLKKENKIKSIQMHYEIDDPVSEYFIFFSDKVSPNPRHIFTLTEDNQNLILTKGSTLHSEAYEKYKI